MAYRGRDEERHRLPALLLERAREMRKQPAPAEQKLWRCLRNRRLNGHKFRRQYGIAPFIADFFCPLANLVVELDGLSHDDRQEYDEDRSRWLNDHGYQVIRFLNKDVQEQLEGVLLEILREVERLLSLKTPPHPNPLPRSTEGEGTRDGGLI